MFKTVGVKTKLVPLAFTHKISDLNKTTIMSTAGKTFCVVLSNMSK